MSTSRTIRRYLDGWAEKPLHPFLAGPLDGLSRAVVIPALAERDSLFTTLADLARQPEPELAHTLVVVVINNRRPGIESAEDIRNNRETLEILAAVIAGADAVPENGRHELDESLACIRRSALRLAAVDASSPGFEIPERDGVGLARKIGLDRALSVLDMDRGDPSFLVCLDADSRVDPGYLSAAGAFFARGEAPGAVIDFAHQEAEDPVLQEAILRYELFLRAYVLGLRRAGSPYAFHTVGSTIACTGEAYAAVRGMSRRRAGEDFYFLNKLAKLGPVGRIGGTVVRPSARPSLRVPFGTGRRMARVLSGEESAAASLYAPEIFRILREWIRLAEENPDRSGDARLAEARRIHPALGRFLEEQAFPGAWEKIRRQAPGPAHLRRQFHGWFDAFRTLRAVHALRDGGLPNVPLLGGVERLLQWTGCPDATSRREETDKAAVTELLAVLREKDREASEPRRFLP